MKTSFPSHIPGIKIARRVIKQVSIFGDTAIIVVRGKGEVKAICDAMFNRTSPALVQMCPEEGVELL